MVGKKPTCLRIVCPPYELQILVGGSVRLFVQHGREMAIDAHHERFHYSGAVRRRRSSITVLHTPDADTLFLFLFFLTTYVCC